MKTNPKDEVYYIVQKKIEHDQWSSLTNELVSKDTALFVRHYVQADNSEIELRIVKVTLVVNILNI